MFSLSDTIKLAKNGKQFKVVKNGVHISNNIFDYIHDTKQAYNIKQTKNSLDFYDSNGIQLLFQIKE